MELLIIGIIIFFGIHLVPIFKIKHSVIQRFGKKPYMAVFSLISALGLGLMIYGKGHAEFITVWQPMAGAHWIPIIIMWPVSMLFVWAEIPCRMKIILRHPMLLGVTLLSTSHLFANGDLATILLMGSFGVYALFTMIRLGFKKEEKHSTDQRPGRTLSWDVVGIVIGTLAYILVFTFHEQITGMPIPVSF